MPIQIYTVSIPLIKKLWLENVDSFTLTSMVNQQAVLSPRHLLPLYPLKKFTSKSESAKPKLF